MLVGTAVFDETYRGKEHQTVPRISDSILVEFFSKVNEEIVVDVVSCDRRSYLANS